MKKIVYTFLFSLAIAGCGDKGEDIPSNKAPYAPTLKLPLDQSNCIANPVALEWNPSLDSDGLVKEYQIEIAKDNNFTTIVERLTSTVNFVNVTLPKATVYYWRVKAIDDKGLSSTNSSTFKFTVPEDVIINQLPNIPEVVYPLNGAKILTTTTVNLKWMAIDPDMNDVLKYDLYVGYNSFFLTKVDENIAVDNYDHTVASGKTYYWKIIARDSKGSSTSSPVWSFGVN